MTERRANKMQTSDELLAMRQGEEQAYRCETHGEYRGKPFTLTGRTWVDPTCPGCEADRKKQEAEEEKQAQAEAEVRRVAIAGVPERFRSATLENYQAETHGQRRALSVLRRYVERFADRRRVGGSLMLLGRTGTGKTHLVCAMVSALVRARWRVRYCDVMGMMQAVKSTYRRDSYETEEQVIEHYVSPDLLVIDEIGVQYGTDAELAMIHHVLDRRYLELRPTVVVGNVDLEGLKAYLGERAVSRLHESGGLVVTFDWDDYRMKP